MNGWGRGNSIPGVWQSSIGVRLGESHKASVKLRMIVHFAFQRLEKLVGMCHIVKNTDRHAA